VEPRANADRSRCRVARKRTCTHYTPFATSPPANTQPGQARTEGAVNRLSDNHQPCTLHPAPCTLHPAPCTLHPAPCTLDLAKSVIVEGSAALILGVHKVHVIFRQPQIPCTRSVAHQRKCLREEHANKHQFRIYVPNRCVFARVCPRTSVSLPCSLPPSLPPLPPSARPSARFSLSYQPGAPCHACTAILRCILERCTGIACASRSFSSIPRCLSNESTAFSFGCPLARQEMRPVLDSTCTRSTHSARTLRCILVNVGLSRATPCTPHSNPYSPPLRWGS